MVANAGLQQKKHITLLTDVIKSCCRKWFGENLTELIQKTMIFDLNFQTSSYQHTKFVKQKTSPTSIHIKHQQVSYLTHIIRRPNGTITKRLTCESNHDTSNDAKLKSLAANVMDFLKVDLNQISLTSIERTIIVKFITFIL